MSVRIKLGKGFYGGFVFSILLVSCLWLIFPVDYKFYSFSSLLLVTIFTVLASVVGDLTVSMLKREGGQKILALYCLVTEGFWIGLMVFLEQSHFYSWHIFRLVVR